MSSYSLLWLSDSDWIFRVLQSLFDSYDFEKTGYLYINQIGSLLKKLGKGSESIVKITETLVKQKTQVEGKVSFQELSAVLLENEKAHQSASVEGPDPKVLEFLRILEEYRVKCEEEGNYLEAGRAHKQLAVLRKQEEKRQQKAIQARHLTERQDVQLAHNMQFAEFNAAWDKYMEDYDSMAQKYIQQMTERHAASLLEFQIKLREELSNRPPKWSKELLEHRRMQHINARNKNYAEAQKLKKISDEAEERERRDMGQVYRLNLLLSRNNWL